MHVSFDESYPKSVGKGVVFDGAGVSSENILKDPKESDSKPVIVEEKLDQVAEEREEDHPSYKSDHPLE